MTKYEEQLSYLQKPNEEEIPDDIQQLFDEQVEKQLEQNGFVNNLFKILPLNALQYKGFWNLNIPYSMKKQLICR